MSGENLQSRCKQSFKGIEKFLRRVAFNLGNTPSQTEVKIISCIPIDVSDLQQKIVKLEKELAEVKSTPKEELSPTNVNVCQPIPKFYNSIDWCKFNNFTARCNCLPETNPKESTSAACTAMTMANQNCSYQPTDNSNLPDQNDHKCTVENKRNIFKKAKRKKETKKDNFKPQLIYYAQTVNSPFNSYDFKVKSTTRTRHKRKVKKLRDISESYFVDMTRRQYQSQPVLKEFSDTSQFTTPICRDIDQTITNPYRNESDVCSCCHGEFHNVDHHENKSTELEVNSNNIINIDNNNKCNYYDSNLYDVIPVKEKSATEEISKIKHRKRDIPSKLHSGDYGIAHLKTKPRPFVVNFHISPQTKFNNPKKVLISMPGKKDKINRTMSKRNKKAKVVNEQKDMDTSKSCCVDCSDVYVKRFDKIKATKKQKSTKLLLTYKNAECLTVNVNDSECQTTKTHSVQMDSTLQYDKTEETLNQVKAILQSVLTEVKTNAQIKNLPIKKNKKDAIIQKGTSYDIVEGGSSLLHSFTYSPYNTNPYNIISPLHMNANQFHCCGLPCSSAKCMQNFPVLIQTPGRHMYASCYRNSSHINKPMTIKQAATISTNTETIRETRSKETDKLIKDIYRSIALNIDIPAKDTSRSEYEGLISNKHDSDMKSTCKVKTSDQTINTTPKIGSKRDTQTHSPFTSNIFNSKLESSVQSHIVSATDTDYRLSNKRNEEFPTNKSTQRSADSMIEEEIEDKASEYTIYSNEGTQISSEETDSENTYITPEETTKKKEKRNLFSKMFKSVNLFKNKKQKEKTLQNVNEPREESDANDSDEYETVYSYKNETTRSLSDQLDRKAPSKISYSKQMRDRNQEKSRRSPCMEQEYRRQWNERLMFQKQQHKYSSGRIYPKEISRYKQPKYWQNFEARTALMNQNISPHRQTCTKDKDTNILKQTYTTPKADAVTTKQLTWLKKHKLRVQCGEQWKKLILEG